MSVSAYISKHRPWRTVISGRLWTYEKLTPGCEVNLLIEPPALDETERALRRDHINPARAIRIGTPPPDAPRLTVQITAVEPEAHARCHSDGERIERVAETLKTAGIRARIAGVDI